MAAPDMRRACGLAALLVLGSAGSAEAKLFDLYAGLHGGQLMGWGSPGDPTTSVDFFETTRGPGAGVDVALELFNVNAAVRYTRIISGEQTSGSLTQLLLGFDGEIIIDDVRRPKTFVHLGAAAGAGVGKHAAQASRLEVSSKGLIAQATVGLERYVVSGLSVGLEAVAGYHYLIAGSLKTPSSNAQGAHLMFLLTAGVHLDPFR